VGRRVDHCSLRGSDTGCSPHRDWLLINRVARRSIRSNSTRRLPDGSPTPRSSPSIAWSAVGTLLADVHGDRPWSDRDRGAHPPPRNGAMSFAGWVDCYTEMFGATVVVYAVDRPRPSVPRLETRATASYPSGHVAAAIVLYFGFGDHLEFAYPPLGLPVPAFGLPCGRNAHCGRSLPVGTWHALRLGCGRRRVSRASAAL